MRPFREERYREWLVAQNARLRSEIPEVLRVRQYHWQKSDDLYLHFLVLYDFREGTRWESRSEAHARKIRESWHGFAAELRGFTAMPYEEIWRGGAGVRSDAPHPLIVEHLRLVTEHEAAWDRWSQDELWPRELRDMAIAAVYRYRALVGDPRYYVQVQEFEDEATMRRKVHESEPKLRPRYWEEWARWMPYVEDLTRLVYEPSDGMSLVPRADHAGSGRPKSAA